MIRLLILLIVSICALLGYMAHTARLRRIADPYLGARAQVRFPRQAIRLLRQAARGPFAADVLQLMESLLLLRREVRRLPALPDGGDGHPRVLTLAHDLADAAITPDGLAAALATLTPPTTPSEVAALPACIAVIQCEGLIGALKALRTEPSRQVALAEEVRQIVRRLHALQTLNRTAYQAQADPLHPALMQDPDGVYPRMDAPSQALLRLRVERVCQAVHRNAADVLRIAVSLCADAEPNTLESSLPYWFLDGSGLLGLHRALRTRRGLLCIWRLAKPQQVRYGVMLLWAIMTGFIFLQCRQPVTIVPCFVLLMGCLSRWALSLVPQSPLPAIAEAPAHLRTLVVLPTVLHDAHDAIRAVRRIKALRHTFPASQADLLLLGDFDAHTSGMGAAGQAIMGAALSAIAALDASGQVMYLQRGRARGGMQGAIECACRLIAQNACEDVLLCATMEPASLHRRYTFVLALPEDAHPAPGMLDRLLRTLCHPLCTHYPTQRGSRGYASAAPARDDAGVRLIQPEAYLSHLDGVITADAASLPLVDALAGCAQVAGARATRDASPILTDALSARHRAAWEAGRLLRWQLPWVQTPVGLVRNPLDHAARFRLREGLKQALIPLAQCLLIPWALAAGQFPLLLAALLAPELRMLIRPTRASLMQLLCRTALLPARACLALHGLWQGAAQQAASLPELPAFEAWTQGLAATLIIATGLALPGMTFPALLLGALLACFPWAHRLHDLPQRPHPPLPAEHTALLRNALDSTWAFFLQHGQDGAALPPATVQFSPDVGPCPTTTPEAIAGYLMAVVCAKETSLLSAHEAAALLRSTAQALARLPLPEGLPCCRYDRHALTVLDAQVSAAAVGVLTCALMTAAQALRAWLPELAPADTALSAELSAAVARFDLRRLYDASAGLFYRTLDANGQPGPHAACFADETLLLSIAACALGLAPDTHLHQLRRSRIRTRGQEVLVTQEGTASQQLLPALFLPLDEHAARASIAMMRRCGQEGLFGQSACLRAAFDASLRYQAAPFGVPQAALHPLPWAPVYAPYAAALCLPFQPTEAAASLAAFAKADCLTPLGFVDALDRTAGQAAVGAYSAYHQGLMMAALSHHLADAPLLRHFCALPEVEACLPLLAESAPPLHLPAPLAHAAYTGLDAPQPLAARSADAQRLPPEQHLLGDGTFQLHISAQGTTQLRARGTALTGLPGLRFYLIDTGRVYPIGGPDLECQVTFAPGMARIHQLCGSLLADLTVTMDPVRHQALHLLTITNLSTRDCTLDVADHLLPDLGAARGTIETAQIAQTYLTAHARGKDKMLHHRVAASQKLQAVTICTDDAAFTARGGMPAMPAILEGPMADIRRLSEEPCLSFRLRLSLTGRAQASVLFTTALTDAPAPSIHEVEGFCRLCGMQQQAMAASLPLTADQALAASLLLGLDAPFLLVLQEERGLARLEDLLAVCAWYQLHGIAAPVEVLCPSSLLDAAQAMIEPFSLPVRLLSNMDDAAPTPTLLMDDLPLAAQAEALRTRRLPSEAPPPPAGTLPEIPLLFPGRYGGFDPETGDYLVHLLPGQHLPLPCISRHASLRIQETVEDLALPEQVQIALPDGTAFSPWTVQLPRCIRLGAGVTTWQCFARDITLTLHACCWPGRSALLRVLRLQGPEDTACTLTLQTPAGLLTRSLSTGLSGHAEAVWATDAAQHITWQEDAEASALLRAVRIQWAQRLSVLTVSTPDEALDLLMNRVLPLQACTSHGAASAAALMHIAPWQALRQLLRAAESAHTTRDWLSVTAALHAYCSTIGPAVCDVRLPGQSLSLLEQCTAAALALPATPDGTHRQDDPNRLLIHALMARLIADIRPSPALDALRRQLLNAADAQHWHGDHYGAPLRLGLQALASAAYDADARTHQAVRTAWDTLYDGTHHLLCAMLPQDIPPLPGSPENGGMRVLDAVVFLPALFKHGMLDEAFTLLRAINPIRRAGKDESFRPAHLLPGGLCAPPMESGHAILAGGDEAAGWLYHLLLTEVIGLRRCGNRIRIAPQVPPDWGDFALTLWEGAATWHILCEHRCKALTIDGHESKEDAFLLQDDGRVHQVRVPLA